MIDFTKSLESFEIELLSRNYAKQTISCYKSCIEVFLKHHNEYPNRINANEIKLYIVNILKDYSPEYATQMLTSLHKFYKCIVKQPKKLNGIDYPKKTIKLTEPLSVEEIQRLFSVIKNTKHLAIVTVLYFGGLRVSEVINLQWADIKRDRKLILIRSGKGGKDRYVKLYDLVIQVLEAHWKTYKSKPYIFSGQNSLQYSATSIRAFLKRYSKEAALSKVCYPHLLRHSYFTHIHEKGSNLRLIQELAGHKNSKTTERYTFVSNRFISQAPDPY